MHKTVRVNVAKFHVLALGSCRSSFISFFFSIFWVFIFTTLLLHIIIIRYFMQLLQYTGLSPIVIISYMYCTALLISRSQITRLYMCLKTVSKTIVPIVGRSGNYGCQFCFQFILRESGCLISRGKLFQNTAPL